MLAKRNKAVKGSFYYGNITNRFNLTDKRIKI